jgi:glycosyltransferase involved in cell wall biosynthesis
MSVHDEPLDTTDAVGGLSAPLISVCMPVYNAERYVAQAIESILNQTLGDFEFLILDDGSSDGSLDKIRRYAERDERIRVTSRANKGLVTSLNEQIDQARGQFLARMDADDIAFPERFSRQADYLLANPDHVLVGSRVRVIDPEGDPLCDWCTLEEQEALDACFLQGERNTPISHPALMMRRDAVLAVGKYRPFEAIEDIDLFLRLSEYGRVRNLPEVLLKYRIHASNLSKTPSYHEAIDRVYGEIVRDARRRRNLPEVLAMPESPRLETSLTAERANWVWWALSSGHVRTARKHARWILAEAPFSFRSWKLMYCALRGY